MGIFTSIGLVSAAIIGTADVATLGSGYFPATRNYVKLQLAEANKDMQAAVNAATSRQISIEIRIEESEKRRIKSKIDELALEREKNPAASENLKRIIKDQIETHEGELEQKEEIIKGLRRLQFQKGSP